MSEREKKDLSPYEKPTVRVIELAADEVLAVSCKTAVQGSGGKNKPPGFGSCIAPACFNQGS